ncbi:MAG: hypothetical protein L6407_07780 [Candidatus Delongbacteria bacterium]|nr:hypothetical protein [Candidatus Delongbacteria bacterium]
MSIPEMKVKKLMALAKQFADIKLWEHIDSDALFALNNRADKQISYISVMGNLGEVFGLAVYHGEKGRLAYEKLIDLSNSGDVLDHFDIPFIQDALTIYFSSRNEADAADLRMIKQSGVVFSNKKMLPIFRTHTPGLYNWKIDEKEVEILISVLEDILELTEILKSRKHNLYNAGKYILFAKTENQWLSKEILVTKSPSVKTEPVKLESKSIPFALANKTMSGVWEMHYFYSNMPIRNKSERPFYGVICLIVDSSAGFIVSHAVASSFDQTEKQLSEILSGVIENGKIIPKEILYARTEIGIALEKTANDLGIVLRKTNNLPCIEDVIDSMNSKML